MLDVLREAAREHGWHLDFTSRDWNECLAALTAGETDVLPGVAYTPKRAERFHFNDRGLLTNWGQVYVRREAELNSLPELQDTDVAVLKGDIHAQAFARLTASFGIGCKTVEYGSYREAFVALTRGRVDAAVGNRIAGASLETHFDIKPTPIIFNPIQLRYALSPTAPPGLLTDFDHTVARLMENKDSVYYRSMNRWFGGHNEPLLPGWVLPATAALVGLTLLLAGASWLLRRKVDAATAELAEKNAALADEIGRRISTENRLRGSLAEKEVMLREIHHRVKNNIQIMSSLLSLQCAEAGKDSAAPLERTRGRLRAMALVHEILYSTQDLAQIEFSSYARRLCEQVAATMAGPGLHLKLDLEEMPLSIDRAVPLGLLLNELVSNALRHAFAANAEGELTVTLDCRDGRARLCVADTGQGLPPGFDLANPPSLGTSLAMALAQQLDGELTAQNPGRGALFCLDFPLETC